MRWTIEDKKMIAKAQKQVVHMTDDWGNETGRVRYRCKGGCRRLFDLDILEVDHIIPRSKPGGVDRPSNLQLLCPACNKKKGNRLLKSSRISVSKSKTLAAKPKRRQNKPATSKSKTARPKIKTTSTRRKVASRPSRRKSTR